MEDTPIPSDANGVFTLISGYLAANGSVIQISQHNPVFEDIATALTQRMMATGVKPMTGPLLLADGTVVAPALVFNSAQTTGFYKTTNGWGFAVGGVLVFEFTAAGIVQTVGGAAIGDYMEATVAVGAAVGLNTNVAANITSLDLGIGDWEVQGNIGFVPSVGSSLTFGAAWVSSVSATLPNADAGGVSYIQFASGQVNCPQGLQTGAKRFVLAAPTTIYLGAKTVHTLAGQSAYGKIAARCLG